MNATFHRILLTIGLAAATWASAADIDRAFEQLHLSAGQESITVKGSIKGRHYIDYQLRAGAGQEIHLSLKSSHASGYFNLLPPGSADAAMVIGEFSNNQFDGMLPDDGVYTVRVFLMRSAARRNETSNFALSVGLAGTPLRAVSAKSDAMLPGTRFHASANVACEPAFSKARECKAWVVRRGYDGTATVEVRWDKGGKRSILFVKGAPLVADVPQAMSFTRHDRGWKVSFDDGEYFEIPEPLVYGG